MGDKHKNHVEHLSLSKVIRLPLISPYRWRGDTLGIRLPKIPSPRELDSRHAVVEFKMLWLERLEGLWKFLGQSG